MDKMRMESVDMTAQNIDKIEALFPNCITEMLDEEHSTPDKKVYKKAVNFELLKQMLSGEVLDGDEAYEFTWVGKKAAIVEANKPIRKTLRPCPEESVDWDKTENLYIEGDNLEVLKLLQESYLGAVKMIYIDPPYNTGKDSFLYTDNFEMDQEDYDLAVGMVDENGNVTFKENTNSNPRFHSDWCSMIFSRLMVARSLLSDDGVIFISIDDNELENLKKICDEVFGAENRLETFNIQVRYGNKSLNEKDDFQKLMEYCLIYAKQRKSFIPQKETTDYDLTKFNLDIRELNKPDKHFTVKGREVDVFLPGSYSIETVPDEKTENMCFFKETWVTGSIYSGTGHGLVYKQVVEPRVEDDGYGVLYKIYGLGEDGLGYRYMTGPKQSTAKFGKMYNKIPLNKLEGLKAGTYKKSKPIINFYDYSPDFGNIRHEGGVAFNGGKKPVKMLTQLIGMVSGNEFICMDFFSGSSSTAHAVMRMNLEDNGKRKFIMVQLPEKCDPQSEAGKSGFSTICELGKERIRRSGEKIKSESPLTTQNLDTGFRVLKLDDSNMNDVYYAAGDYTQDLLTMMESNVKSDRNDLDLLFGCLLEWGLPLSLPYSSEKIDGCTVHNYNDGDLIACFDENIPDSVVKAIANKKPLRAVFRDSSFNGSPAKINVEEIFKLLAPDTRVKVI